MQCSGCKVSKLSNEFPRGRVTEYCRHRPWCLREIENDGYDALCSRLALVTHEDLFETQSTPAIPLTTTTRVPVAFKIFVTTLTGEHKEIAVASDYTAGHLRLLIKVEFGLEVEYQRLFFNKKELELTTKLTQYGIGPGSKVQVQQVLLALKSHTTLNNIEFVLTWGYTTVAPAYMNGSCLIFCGDQYIDAVNFQNTSGFTGIFHHGRAKMNYRTNEGRQAISISLNNLHYTFRVSTLAQFVYPSVQMFDQADPETLLAPDFKIENVSNSQAVIMCCLHRDPTKGWIVTAIGRPSRGQHFRYEQIVQTIRDVGLI